eukprot:13904901-Alexandrium_andersonii.AAC.1
MAPRRGRVAIAGRLCERPRASGSEALQARSGIFPGKQENTARKGAAFEHWKLARHLLLPGCAPRSTMPA